MSQATPMEHSSVLIKLSRADRIYYPGDTATGNVIVNCYKGWSHQGVKILVEGKVETYLATRVAGIVETAVPAGRPTVILREEVEVTGPGKFADGVIELPFSFPVKAIDNKTLLESYHGAYVSIIYTMTATCDRGVLKKSLVKESEFIVEIAKGKPATCAAPATFSISPDGLENIPANMRSSMPKFHISGKLHHSCYSISQPFTGEVKIESSDGCIKSMELQLVRVESVITNVQTHKEATEVQSIQVAEGNVCRNMIVPLYMVFPRLFACSTLKCPHFTVEFEINLIIHFADGYVVTENFPITIYREA